MDILNLIKEEIAKTSCPTSHYEFLTKLSSRLWKIPHFFISLLFKKNEDINPTKASDLDMNPDHYNLALEEVNQFLKEYFIENRTLPPWACEAFYVNKRAEKVRGKLKLVINYQPLNHFFEDDKFPLLKQEVYSKDYLRHKYSLNLIWRQDFGCLESNQKICLKRVYAFLFAITTGRSCLLV